MIEATPYVSVGLACVISYATVLSLKLGGQSGRTIYMFSMYEYCNTLQHTATHTHYLNVQHV